MSTCYLLLGSNIGERTAYLAGAREKIEVNIGPITLASQIYETAAWGLTDQQAFLNQVLQVSTNLTPEKLLKEVNLIEKELGRVREIKWGARVIDIDILYYDAIILQTEKLIIPHPEMQNRRFTLEPLAEIAPDYVHPVLQKTNKQLLLSCPDKLEVNLYLLK